MKKQYKGRAPSKVSNQTQRRPSFHRGLAEIIAKHTDAATFERIVVDAEAMADRWEQEGAGASSAVQSFTVNLPAHAVRRMQFFAAEERISPEQYLARACVHRINGDLVDPAGYSVDEEGDEKAVDKLNQPPTKGGKRHA